MKRIGAIISMKSSLYKHSVGDLIKNDYSFYIEILERIWKNKSKGYKYRCMICGNVDEVTERAIKNRRGCSYCLGHKVQVGFNDLWTTDPDIAKLLLNPIDGQKYTSGSGQKLDFKCSQCGEIIKNKMLCGIKRRGLSCPYCSDGISYPEKFVSAMLSQTPYEYEIQKTFSWSKSNHLNKNTTGNKRYDLYLPKFKTIIEIHGGQHYGVKFYDSDVVGNDKLKVKMAIENGYKMVVIDARESNQEFIKNNILNSELSELLDLSNVDWVLCHHRACNSMIKIVSDLYNSGKTTNEIVTETKLGMSTINRYLHEGTNLGLCKYNPQNSFKLARKKLKKIIQISLENILIAEYECLNDAAVKTGINSGSISRACKGEVRTAGGYLWMYKDEYEEKKDNINMYKKYSREKAVVRLSLNGEYIDEFKSIEDAKELTGVHYSNISAACSGKRKTAKGFKWMFKSDYLMIKQSQLYSLKH